jgi:hypothetical protein
MPSDDREGLLAGHETINGAASVYTSAKSRGASKACGKGLSLRDDRI